MTIFWPWQPWHISRGDQLFLQGLKHDTQCLGRWIWKVTCGDGQWWHNMSPYMHIDIHIYIAHIYNIQYIISNIYIYCIWYMYNIYILYMICIIYIYYNHRIHHPQFSHEFGWYKPSIHLGIDMVLFYQHDLMFYSQALTTVCGYTARLGVRLKSPCQVSSDVIHDVTIIWPRLEISFVIFGVFRGESSTFRCN